MAEDPLDELRRGAKDVVCTGLGLGILGVQALQVRRRDLEKALGVGIPPSPDDVGRLLGRLAGNG